MNSAQNGAGTCIAAAVSISTGWEMAPFAAGKGVMQRNELRRALSWGWHWLVLASVFLAAARCGAGLALRISVNAAESAENQVAGPITVQAGVMAGQRLSGPLPRYPKQAKKAGLEGTVVLDAVIGRNGDLIYLTVRSGPMELRKSALDAVSEWKYRPYLEYGRPVTVETEIDVVYSLRK